MSVRNSVAWLLRKAANRLDGRTRDGRVRVDMRIMGVSPDAANQIARAFRKTETGAVVIT